MWKTNSRIIILSPGQKFNEGGVLQMRQLGNSRINQKSLRIVLNRKFGETNIWRIWTLEPFYNTFLYSNYLQFTDRWIIFTLLSIDPLGLNFYGQDFVPFSSPATSTWHLIWKKEISFLILPLAIISIIFCSQLYNPFKDESFYNCEFSCVVVNFFWFHKCT